MLVANMCNKFKHVKHLIAQLPVSMTYLTHTYIVYDLVIYLFIYIFSMITVFSSMAGSKCYDIPWIPVYSFKFLPAFVL